MESRGFIWLWWGDSLEKLPEIPWFSSAEVDDHHTFHIASITIPVSYCRWFEGAAFDIPHFPSAHENVFPRRAGPLVHGFQYRREGDWISFSARYCRDPMDPGASLEKSSIPIEADVIFPTLLLHKMKHVNAGVYVVSLSCPIDDESTWTAIKYYKRPGLLPGVLDRLLVIFMSKFAFGTILNADLRIQRDQLPRDTGHGADCPVAKGDELLVLFWQMWQQSLKGARRAYTQKPSEAASLEQPRPRSPELI